MEVNEKQRPLQHCEKLNWIQWRPPKEDNNKKGNMTYMNLVWAKGSLI
jgi:hypothetical protein